MGFGGVDDDGGPLLPLREGLCVEEVSIRGTRRGPFRNHDCTTRSRKLLEEENVPSEFGGEHSQELVHLPLRYAVNIPREHV